jgi:mono/diheme cytochrome c family protein
MLWNAGAVVLATLVVGFSAGGPARWAGSPVPGAVPEVPADTLGRAIFTGRGLCAACHGATAKGTVLAPDLTDGEWIHLDGGQDADSLLASMARLVKAGVAQPTKYPAPMPPMGGAQLSDAEILAVSRYVLSLSGGS